MHKSSMLRMEWFYKNYCEKIKKDNKIVLDVGSYCVKGHQTYKSIFNNRKYKYYGLDIAKGNNVDITIKNPYSWKEIKDNFCDILISGQAFEHIEFPWVTISEIARTVKLNGLMCIIAPHGLGLHRYPVDCWRFYNDGMIALARWAGLKVLHASTNLAPKGASPDWYDKWQDCMLIAQKTHNTSTINIKNYKCKPLNLEKMSSGLIPPEQQSWYKK